MVKTDFLVIGGGILGLSVALELKKRNPGQSVTLLEKEKSCGMHASGRNSGVIHAGLYYPPQSLKARLTIEGNQLLTQYCVDRKLPLLRCGKLVVASSPEEVPRLHALFERGRGNGVPLDLIDEKQALEIEPRAITHSHAIFSPTTSAGDPKMVTESLVTDANDSGIQIMTGVSYLGRRDDQVATNKGPIQFGYLINCAGLYADKIAKDFGFSKDYEILPFKGIYLYSDEPAHSYRTHIYPVPDPQFPFLGVHVTLTTAGKSKIGPTAIPAFWREQYRAFKGFSLPEFMDIAVRGTGVFFSSGPDFKKLIFEELSKYSKKVLVERAQRMARGIEPAKHVRWGPSGIRAQLVNKKTSKLEMDFLLEKDEKSLHVLNAVSPGWTCGFSFAKYLVGELK